MERSSSVATWEAMKEPGSSEDNADSPDDEEDELRSSGLKRKGLQLPLSRVNPKRQRTVGGSSGLTARLHRPNGLISASAGSSDTKSHRSRASQPGSSRPSPARSAIAETSGRQSSEVNRSSQTTAAPPFLRRSKSPQTKKLSKPVGQAKGRERSGTAKTGFPAPRSRSSSGPTRLPSRSKSVIELSDSSDNGVSPAKYVIKEQNAGSDPPSTIRIPDRFPPKTQKRTPSSLPPEGAEVITIDDSEEETSSVSKPKLAPNPVLQKEIISPLQPSLLPSTTIHRPASKDTPPNSRSKRVDSSDKTGMDSNVSGLPSPSQSVPYGHRAINRTSVTIPVVAESSTRKSIPTIPLLDLRITGRRPLPESRSSLPGSSRTNTSKLPTDGETREPRPPVLPTKSSSQATPLSAGPRRSSDLDMSGLKDVLTDAVSLSSRRDTRPIELEKGSPSPVLPSSGKDLRPALQSSGASSTIYQSSLAIKGKQKQQSISSDLSMKNETSSNAAPECIDLTLDSDSDVAPPPLFVPRPLPLPRPSYLASSIKSSKDILTKREPPPSPSLPKANSRSTEPDTALPSTASPIASAARNDTPIRPMPLPFPTPRPRPPSQELKKTPPISTSVVENAQPTNPSPHHSQSSNTPISSLIDHIVYTSDGDGSGSGLSSASSPNETLPARIPLLHRTARKSTRGRLSSQGLPSLRRSVSVSSRTPPNSMSVSIPQAGSSVSPSSSQPLVESSPEMLNKFNNLETCVPPTSKMMEVVTEDVQASLSTIKYGEFDGTLVNIPQEPITSVAILGSFAEASVASAPTFDDDSELEYVDDPVLELSRLEPLVETDSIEMMDVEELLAASRQDSPILFPETEARGTSSESLDLIDTEEGQQLRRSTQSSRSVSGEPTELYLDNDGFVDSGSSPPTSPTPEDFSVPAPVRTFGGFQSLNWRTYRQDPENMQPKCYFSKDLPHTLQDTINSFSEAGRRHISLRTVMEAAIRENTAEDEPDAPLIEIINEVDDDPTPPWEFHYSNKMWFGEDVPLPDLTKVVHCNCVGRCDPKIKPCACAERQRDWVDGMFQSPDFLYDGKGHVKATDYPVFECNDLCGCSDECRNRVVQHGRKCAIRIQKTAEKGWGVFAGAKKIYAGSFIGVYAGELLTDRVGEIRGITYNKFGRTYLFDLDFWHLKQGKEDWDIQYTVDAYHAGNFTRFLNHSCDPNCSLVSCYINDSDLQKPLLTVFAKRDIEPFEELCFSYSGESGDGEQGEEDPRSSPAGDKDAVYIKCACKAWNCTGYMFK
ncbi:Histone-lysine N-methyltransferase, H3 lysine-9 specific [Termitomyces sp. T112]|nr:Histone-lysine N-methyltransferase, H3 lysine-9 specific [Termitomyces sp. T112]